MSDVIQPSPQARTRIRYGLHAFPLTTQIEASSCRTDKIEIAVNGTIDFAERDHLDDFLGLFATVSITEDTPNVLNGIRGNARNIQKIRRSTWHLGGRLVHRSYSDNRRSVRLELSLNPTRFAEHCRQAFTPHAVEDLRDIPIRSLLLINNTIRNEIRRGTLDGSDNEIEAGAWLTTVTRDWQNFVALYADAACRLVEEDFNERSRIHWPVNPPQLRFQLPSETPPSIGYVEQHVEFQVDDARAAFASLERAIRTAAHSYQLSELYRNRLRWGREISARWCEVSLRNGVGLKVYSKSATRLRIEVEYSGRSAGGASTGELLRPEHRFTGNMNLLQRIDALRRDAASRLNTFLNILVPSPAAVTEDPATRMRLFVTALYGIRQPRAAVSAFLSELFADGSVGGSSSSPIGRVAEAMRRQGFLHRVSVSEGGFEPRYAPDNMLQLAIARLTNGPGGAGNDPSLEA